MSNTVKTRLFTGEPMANKELTDVPGVGEATSRILQERGITNAHALYEHWLELNKDKTRFNIWLRNVCGTTYQNVNLDLITRGFEKWHHKFGREENVQNSNAAEADENGPVNDNRNDNNRRPASDDAAPPRDNKRARPDSSDTGSTSFAEAGPSSAGAGPSFAEAGPSVQPAEVDVVVLGENDRQLNEAEAKTVNKYLEDSILASAKDPNTSVPRFKRVSFSAEGVLQFSCADLSSVEWLKTTIANAPETDGKKVIVKKSSELPGKSKVIIFIHDCKDSVEDTTLILMKQNEWAQIQTWHKNLEVEKDSVLFLEFWTPDPIVQTLLKKGGQLSYKLGSVPVWVNAADACQLLRPDFQGDN